MTVDTIVALIQNFGFPIAVAIWALMKLDKLWSIVESMKASLESIEESIEKQELVITKILDVQNEIAVTIKIFSVINNKQIYGGDIKDGN